MPNFFWMQFTFLSPGTWLPLSGNYHKNLFVCQTFGVGEGVRCSLFSIGSVEEEGASSRASRFLPSGSHSHLTAVLKGHVIPHPRGYDLQKSRLAFISKEGEEHCFVTGILNYSSFIDQTWYTIVFLHNLNYKLYVKQKTAFFRLCIWLQFHYM